MRLAQSISTHWLAAALVCFPGIVASASTPVATQPAAEDIAAEIATRFSELAHPDTSLRYSAKIALMEMRRADLSVLREVVAANQPLMPSQAAVLRDIVTHVYLSGEEYESADQSGFLGVRQLPLGSEFDRAGALQPDSRSGVMIMERMPGFCGFEALMDGDVVLQIVERPNLLLRGTTAFSAAIQAIGAGKKIHFDVLRGGQVVRVPVTLDARPAAAEQDALMEELLRQRRLKGEQYWIEYFAPMLKESVS